MGKIIIETANSKLDIQSAREIINKELFFPTGRSLQDFTDTKEGVFYVVAKDRGKVIGAGRLSLCPTVNGSSDFWKALNQSLSSVNYKLEELKDDTAVMSGIVLEPSYRGQGIGSKLYEWRESIAQKNKKKLIVSRIRPDAWNIYTHRSYTEFGSDEIKFLSGGVMTRKWVYKII